MSDYISAVLTEENRKKVLAHSAEIKNLVAFGIKLSTKEKKLMNKMEDGRLPFVEKSLSLGQKQAAIVPPYTNINELNSDLELFKSLKEIEYELNSLVEIISDTRTAAGADAYNAALSIYKSAKGAAKMGVPGTQSIVDELSILFEKSMSADTAK